MRARLKYTNDSSYFKVIENSANIKRGDKGESPLFKSEIVNGYRKAKRVAVFVSIHSGDDILDF